MLCLGLDGDRLGVRFSIVNPSATETPMLIRELVEGGSKLQFMELPQQPDEVALQVLHCLDQPCLESFVRSSDSWTARLCMLAPNILHRVLPLFEYKAERGHARYLKSLEERGIIRQGDRGWELIRNHQGPK